jgi:hypothetical protein
MERGDRDNTDPGVALARYIRRMMKPIRVAPCEVRDGSGKVVAVIETDPVTGARKRRSLDG